MGSLLYFLRVLFTRLPQEVLVALLRAIVLLLFTILLLLLKFIEWLCALLRRRDLYPEEKDKPCGKIPEAVIRRPDPCLYSQRLLMSQGLPVTWNNPDIWVARADNPAGIEPDSYHLQDDTDYIVTVRVHNASTDPAIGVRVRLNYRPWSFNSPDLVPVETDANGDEVVRFVHVPPMSSVPLVPGAPPVSPDLAQFMWHTPKLDPGQPQQHYCLQASLFHPLDVNTGNNMGQENTNVYRSNNPGPATPGETVTFTVPLFNLARRPQRFVFEAQAYAVNEEDSFELDLKTTRGYARQSLSQRLGNLMPSLHVKAVATGRDKITSRSRFNFQYQPRLVGVKTRYEGFDEIKKTILSRDYSLPPGMIVTVDGNDLQEGIVLQEKGSKDVEVAVKTPPDARPGMSIPMNLWALSEDGVLAGGVTVIFNFEEGQ
jgi:hypothetical protein